MWSIGRGWVWLPVVLSLVGGCAFGRPEPTPAELAQQAAAATDKLTSVHFVLTIEGGPAYLDAGRTLNLRQAEGDLLRPDRAQVTARVSLSGFVVNVKFINIGPRGFMTDPLSGRWGPAPQGLGYNAAYLFIPEQGVPDIIRGLDKISKVGEQQIDGVDTYQVTGEIATSRLVVLTGGAMPGERVKVDLWISKDTSSLRQFRLTEIGAAKAPVTWTLTLSRHDQPVTIEPPL
jgi:hypothetical protein